MSLLRLPKEKAWSLKVGMMELALKVRVQLEFGSELVELWLLRLEVEKLDLSECLWSPLLRLSLPKSSVIEPFLLHHHSQH